jgi:hypothetical protein
VWDSKTLDGLVSNSAEACVNEIVMPDYPIYSASTSAHTPADELMIGGECKQPRDLLAVYGMYVMCVLICFFFSFCTLLDIHVMST